MSRLKLIIVIAAICIPALGMAQTSTQAPAAAIGPAKIAWMNLQEALLTSDEGKSMVSEIQKFIDDKQKTMDGMRDEAEKLRNQLNVQGAKLTDEARQDLADQVEQKETSAQRFQQDTQKEIEARQIKMNSYLSKRMLPVVEKYAKEKGLSAIFILNSGRDAYVDQSLIVTSEIVKAYNQTYAGASKTPAAPAPKKP